MRRYLFLFFSLSLTCCISQPSLEGLQSSSSPETRERGRHLVQGLAACGFCHGEQPDPFARLSGGRPVYDRYGEVSASNLTPAITGLGEWTPLEIMRAIRAGVRRDGSLLSSPDVHSSYEWMSDPDTLAIVAYLRSLPKTENEVPRRSLSFLERNTTGFFESRGEEIGFVPRINDKFPVQYGGYLVDHVARCVTCHNSPAGFWGAEEYLAGGKVIKTEAGEQVAPSLLPSENALGGWSEQQIVDYLRTARTPSGQTRNSSFCPTRFYAQATDDELRAVAKFLKSLTF